MFNLDNAILKWRRQMAAKGVKAPEVLDELESHLRDDIKGRTDSGLSVEQAFEAAVQQMGHPAAVRAEFRKLGRRQRWPRRAQKGMVCFVLVGFLVLVGLGGFFKAHTTAVAAGILGFLGVSLLILSIWLRQRATAAQTELALSHFTTTARLTLDLARAEAPRLHHNFVGTEHLLLGLTELETGIVPEILRKLGLSREAVRREVDQFVSGFVARGAIGNIPFTPRVRKALQLAAQEAKALNRTDVGSEHILLGLLREGDGVAARVLKNLGVRMETIRKAISEQSASG